MRNGASEVTQKKTHGKPRQWKLFRYFGIVTPRSGRLSDCSQGRGGGEGGDAMGEPSPGGTAGRAGGR